MSDVPRLDYLPPPPSRRMGTVTTFEGLTVIELKGIVSRWVWIAALLGGPAVFFAVTTGGIAIARLTGWGAVSRLGAVLSMGVLLAAFVLVLAAFLTSVIKAKVTIDGRELTIQDNGVRSFPRERVRAVRTVVLKEDGLRIHPERPPGQFLSRGPTVAMELDLPEGRLRFLSMWDAEEVTWAVDIVRRLLDLPEESAMPEPASNTPSVQPTDESAPPAVAAAKAYGPARAWGTAALAATGLAAVVFSMFGIVPGVQSTRWPVAAAVVTHSRYEEIRRPGGDTRFVAEIAYRYTVDGRDYTGSRFGVWRDDTDSASRALVKAHPVNHIVPASYDPANPGRAVLIPGVSLIAWVLAMCGAIFVALSGWLFFTRPTRRQEALLVAYPNNPVTEAAVARVGCEVAWTVPERVERLERRQALRRLVFSTTRVAVVIGVILFIAWLVFGQIAPARLWWGVGGLLGLLYGLHLMEVWLGRPSASRPREYWIDEFGLHLPVKKYPLRQWRRFKGYSVVPHPLDAGARQVLLWLKPGGQAPFDVTLPDEPELADRVIARIALRLPPTEPETAKRHVISRRSIWAGIALAIALAFLAAWYLDTHVPEWRSATSAHKLRIRFIAASLFVAGPGLLWATADALARRRFLPNAHLGGAFFLNMLGVTAFFLALILFEARRLAGP